MISDAEFLAIKSFDRSLARNNRNAQAIIDEKDEIIAALEAIVLRMHADMLAERATSAGLRVQVKALVSAHPESELLRQTGRVYPDGRKQTVGGVMFEVAFDKKAKELGHSNPSSIREIAEVPSTPSYAPRR